MNHQEEQKKIYKTLCVIIETEKRGICLFFLPKNSELYYLKKQPKKDFSFIITIINIVITMINNREWKTSTFYGSETNE